MLAGAAAWCDPDNEPRYECQASANCTGQSGHAHGSLRADHGRRYQSAGVADSEAVFASASARCLLAAAMPSRPGWTTPWPSSRTSTSTRPTSTTCAASMEPPGSRSSPDSSTCWQSSASPATSMPSPRGPSSLPMSRSCACAGRLCRPSSSRASCSPSLVPDARGYQSGPRSRGAGDARCWSSAAPRPGLDGAISAARAAYIGGVAATSNVLAGGSSEFRCEARTHSWVQVFGDEQRAFDSYADASRKRTLLVDTYDSLAGVEHAIVTGRASGHKAGLSPASASTRATWLSLDRSSPHAGRSGLHDTRSSPPTTSTSTPSLRFANRPRIDVWGVGTRLDTCYDQPALGAIYKLSAICDADAAGATRQALRVQLEISIPACSAFAATSMRPDAPSRHDIR